jgi:hypothetical protein
MKFEDITIVVARYNEDLAWNRLTNFAKTLTFSNTWKKGTNYLERSWTVIFEMVYRKD